MHGRSAYGDGEQKAARYIAGRFEEYGLKKINNDWFQKFSFSINTFPGQVFFEVSEKKLKAGYDFIVHAESPSANIKSRIVFLDTLIFSSPQVQQKFLKKKTSSVCVAYNASDAKKIEKLPEPLIAKIYSSKAIIEIQNKKLTMSVGRDQQDIPVIEVLKDKLPSNTKKAKINIEAKFLKDYTSQNVIGYIEGSAVKDSFILISAHYDHLGHMGSEVYFPGANDNASGVSMLLELADYYSKNTPKYSMLFIAFGAEEAGLIGSRYYTENPWVALNKIKFMLNLDLLGTGDEGIMAVNGSVFEKEFSVLQKINEENNLLPAVKKRGKAANSDHYYFTEKGVRSFFLYTLGGISAYHDVYDIPATLPLTKFKEVFTLITKFIERISE
ncbi:MAG: M28 family peptidase [Cytophagaceae bacterium]|nr:M28 family peptidase [Cytophagaceae bacterium]MDW8456333.1 M28 family peptidase [Cytophagaceae bacterium]